MSDWFIGIDIGGTRYSLALADSRGRLVRKIRRRTVASHEARGVVAGLLDLLPGLLRQAQRQGARVGRIGIGFGGPVDYATGRILLSHHVGGWSHFPLRERLQRHFAIDTVIDNDGNAGALGEFRFGAGRGCANLLYVNVGTGIGGGIIVNGRLLRGAHNLAGEIGHVTVASQGPICTCGRHGCLESLASGPAIARRANELRRPTGRPGRALTCQAVFQRARRGEAWALQAIGEAAQALAQAIGASVCLFNPSLVILGGGVSESGGILLRPLRRALPRYVLDQHRHGLRIVTARLGYDAGVRGAVALAMEIDG